MPLDSGSMLGPYRILALLGAGAMGEVYRALDTRLDRELAVKILTPQLAEDAGLLARFEQEAKAVAALSHPNILGIHDFGQQGSIRYAAMELLHGESLRDLLGSGPIPLRRALGLARQMALGLAAAHDKGIVHRDLKPENLFVTQDGQLKILDFGLAKRLPAAPGQDGATRLDSAPPGSVGSLATISGTLLGTVGYMSPEQARGEAADHRSDIFSFGVVLYEMLGGRKAFQRDSAPETLTAIIRESPEELDSLRPGIPEAVQRILAHCLEKQPGARFQSMRDVAFTLESILNLALVEGSSAARRRRKVPWKWLALAILPALAAAGAWAARDFLPFRSAPQPVFTRVSFRQGHLHGARFTPDGGGIVYSAAWGEGDYQLYTSRLDSLEDRPLEYPRAQLLGLSSSGELALALRVDQPNVWIFRGTLARAPLGGGAPRELLAGVEWADWSSDGQPAVIRHLDGRWRVEFPIGKVLAETPGWFSHLRFSPDGTALAFLEHPIPNDDAGYVNLLELRSGAVKRLTRDWYTVQGLAWKGEEVWFTASEVGIYNALHATTRSGRTRRILRIPGALNLHDVSRDGRLLLSTEDQRTGILFLGPGGARDLSWRTWSYLWSLSADGGALLFDEEGESAGPDYDLFLRHTDGSPAVLLGQGAPSTLSPDGAWVATVQQHPRLQLSLIPTGPGESRSFPLQGIASVFSLTFTPDGKKVIFAGGVKGKGTRAFLLDLAGGAPRPLTPEGTSLPLRGAFLSPDGRQLLALPIEGPMLCEVENPGKPPQPVKGLARGEWILSWARDRRRLLVYRPGPFPVVVSELDPSTGTREPWRTLAPPGFLGSRMDNAQLSQDGNHLACNYRRRQSVLFLVEGLR